MLRITGRAVSGLLLAVLALELLFRLLPVSTATKTGYYVDPDVLTYPANHRWRVSTGWDLRNPQTVHSNNLGFVADIDFSPDARGIALIGDSYVESSMLDAVDRPGAQLQRRLPARPVYALGGPGSSLLDYAQRIRWSHETLNVRDFVLLVEQFDARQSLCGSGNVHGACLDPRTFEPRRERLPPPSKAKRLLRHSALAQYLVVQIRVQPQGLLKAMFTRSTPERDGAARAREPSTSSARDIEEMQRRVDAVTRAFFDAAGPHLTGRLIVLVDGRRAGRAVAPELIDLERAHLMHRLREGRAEVIDLEPVFAAHAARSRWSLDVGPHDGHLNRWGVGLAMDAAAAALRAPFSR